MENAIQNCYFHIVMETVTQIKPSSFFALEKDPERWFNALSEWRMYPPINAVLTICNEVVKVMFLQVSVCPGGAIPACLATSLQG